MLIPKLLPIPFAENGRKNTIPDNRTSEMQAHLASFDTGFPPITMQPKQDGGLPPDGMDMNGILYDLSAHAVYQNKGGQYKFDAEYAELIGGYPKGAILLSDDETKQYISVSENNKDDFNTSTSANWKVISLADIDVLLNNKVSSQTMADALNLKADKTYVDSELLNKADLTYVNTELSRKWDIQQTIGAGEIVRVSEIEVPVDQIFYFDSETPPVGFISRSGQAIDKVKMPKLFARYGANMPDDRDRVHRMTGTLAGAVGTTQEDAIRNIKGMVYGLYPAITLSSSGAFSTDTHASTAGLIPGNNAGVGTIFFDASKDVPTTVADNRVKSRIILACNKIQ